MLWHYKPNEWKTKQFCIGECTAYALVNAKDFGTRFQNVVFKIVSPSRTQSIRQIKESKWTEITMYQNMSSILNDCISLNLTENKIKAI